MTEYQLHCFAQSGNAYRAALMLNLVGADWEPIFVDFFNGETRSPAYRSSINEMGEAPVLVHRDRKLSQSAVILEYLARSSGQFLPHSEDGRLEAWRWIVFDNQKVGGSLGPYRFLRNFASRSATGLSWISSKAARSPRLPLSTSDCRASRTFSAARRASRIFR
jgi:glutathione S-transferase